MNKIIIAIDGLSGCGKSSTAKKLSQNLSYTYLDSGAMYRAVTLYFIEHNVDIKKLDEIIAALQNIETGFRLNPSSKASETYLNGTNVEDKIRSMEVSKMVSEISALKEVRAACVKQQRILGENRGVVMDGRDIGSVVFPDAELKIFMIAELEVRAQRRYHELLEKGENPSIDQIRKNLEDRDQMDTSRDHSPLFQSEDAVVIDTTHLTFDEQVDQILQLAKAKIIEVNQPGNH